MGGDLLNGRCTARDNEVPTAFLRVREIKRAQDLFDAALKNARVHKEDACGG